MLTEERGGDLVIVTAAGAMAVLLFPSLFLFLFLERRRRRRRGCHGCGLCAYLYLSWPLALWGSHAPDAVPVAVC
jgi:hypothetical protein